MKKQFLLFCILAEIMSLNAQTIYYWRNDQNPPTNASWSSASPLYFWNGTLNVGELPPGGDVIQFDGTNGLISTNDLAATNRFKMNFYVGSTTTVSRTLNGTTTNVFYDYNGASPLIQNWSGLLQTINFPFQIGNTSASNFAYGMQIYAGNGDLNIGSTISAANATGGPKELVLTTDGTKNLTLSGVISNGSGAIKLAKWGTGTLFISGNNTYTGSTTVSDGTLKLGSPTALGSVTGATTVNSGYTLDLNGITYTNAEPLTIRGIGYSSAGAISNSSATAATFPGLLTLASSSTITGGTGAIALTHTGTITGAFDLTLDGNSGGSIASIIGTSTGNLVKNGSGIWKLSGVNAYTGQTQINNGELWIESGGDINSGSAIWFGNGGTLSTTAKLYLSSLTGGTTFARDINVNAGNSGTRIIGGINTSLTNTFSGKILRSSNQPLTIDVPNAGGTVTVSGVINGTGDVKKTGYGTLNLSGTNTQTGSWLIEQGFMNFSTFGSNLNGKPIILGNATEVGTATYNGAGGGNFATAVYTNAGGGQFNCILNTGSLSLQPGTQSQTLSGNLSISVTGLATNSLSLKYNLGGTGGITLSAGKLTLFRNDSPTGVNTYSGTTTINAGTLTLGYDNAIPSGAVSVQSAVTINGGTLSTGATSLGFSSGTSTYPMGVLTVGASGGTIVMAATTSTQNLYFANSSSATWGGGTLTITGWTGTVGGTGTNGHIYIGTGTGALTDTQLAKIIFSGYSGHAMLLSTGELVPLISPKYFSSGNFASPNSWTETSAAAMTAITGKGPNFNTTYYHSTTSNNAGTDYFKFFSNASGSGSYYGPAANSAVALSTSFSMSTANRAAAASYTITGINGERHVFKTIGTTTANASAVVFDLGLSGVVQTISSVSQSPASGSVYPGYATTVTATISGAFTGSQKSYLRYSTSSTFATSTVVAMTGSGTTYSADIPSGTNVAGTPIYYYVFTSGSGGTNPAADGSDADLFAINYNDNAGANYSYTPLASIPAITFTVASPGTGSSGYVGNTVTVTGANLTGVNSLKIGGLGGTTVSTFTVVNSTTITFNAINATGTIWLSDGTNTASSAATYTNLGYLSNADADWNTGSTWLGGAIPAAGSAVNIANAVTLNTAATNNPVSVTINSTKSLTLGASGALIINAGGSLTNNGNVSLGNNGSVTLAVSATITGATTFNNLTLNGTTTLNNAPTVNGTMTLNSSASLVSNSPIYGATATLNYNLNNGYVAKYNQALEWPATSGPNFVLLTNNSWVQLTGDRSLTGNLTVTSGALQATGALRTLTMNGTTQTITVSTTTGGAIYGTDNGVNNDLQLTIANGSTTTFTGYATATDDDDKKFLNINVNSGGTLALARGILCKWGTFIVNGTLKINANGYIQSNNTSNSAAASTNKAADYSGGGSLVYNNGGSYTSSDKEWPTTNSPVNVTIQNAGTNVSLNDAKTITGILTLTNGHITLGGNDLTIGAAGSISGASSSNFIVTDGIGKLVQSVTNSVVKTFPIGSSASSYDPAVINPTSSVVFAAKVGATLSGTPLNAGLTNAFEWDITPASGTPTATITLTPSVATNTSNPVIGYYSGSAWTESSASLSGTSFSGTVNNFGKFATGSQFAFAHGIPTVTVTPIGTYTYNGSAQGPIAATTGGSAGAVTFSYAGTGYGPTAVPPTNAGTYTATATVAASGNYTSASSSATAFSINDAPNTVSVTTLNPTLASLGLNAASDVTITSSGTLTVNADKTVNSVTVDAGGKLVLSANTLTVKDLVINSGKLDTESPSISLSNAMAISLGGSVKLQKTLDASKWYFISFPCNVAISSITQVSTTGVGTLGAIETNWWIKYYDGEARVQNLGTATNWVSMTAGETLTANKGYIIGIADELTLDHVLSFTLENTLVTTAESAVVDKTIPVVTYGEGFVDNKNTLGNIVGENHKGWNLVGSPYLSKYDGSGIEANFLTFHNGLIFEPKLKTAIGRNINPFEAFFVQCNTV
ncbi:MAG: autotransporter-associated beta strand repeat-containing protein, partial [Paludibacter sp.]